MHPWWSFAGAGQAVSSVARPELAAVGNVSPAFFNFVNNLNGRNPIAALHGGGPDFAGPADLFPGLTSPAQPGEFVSLFATGLGPTNPQFESGEVPGQVASVTGNVSVSIDGAVAPPATFSMQA